MIMLKLFAFLSLIFIMFSRVWYGVHSINQCITGSMIGITSFFVVVRIEDFMLKKLFWPLIYKERFRHKNAFAYLSFIFIGSNYIFFSYWAHVYTNFENQYDFRKWFPNCIESCFPNEATLRQNFSTKILRESLIFNFFFGVIIGIFLNKDGVFTYKGLYTDNDLKKYILRMLILAVYLSPMCLIVYPKITHPILNFSRSLLVSVSQGIVMMTVYLWTLKKLNLYPKYVNENT